jgi:CRP-like cAMP-binding protein
MATVDVRGLRAAADERAAAGRWPEALELYRQVVAADPGDVATRQRLAAGLARVGRMDHAIQQYEVVAAMFADQGMLLKAVAAAKMVLRLDGGRHEAEQELARLYAMKGKATVSRLPPAQDTPVDWSAIPLPTWRLTPEEAQDREEARAVRGLELEPVPAPPRATGDLPAIPLFSSLEPEGLLAVIERLTMRTAEPGEVLMREGDPGAHMVVVVQGTVAVLRGEAAGGGQKIAQMRDGAFFGEMALLSHGPRSATVQAETPCVLLELTRADLDEITATHPAVREVVERFYRERLLDNLLRCSPLFQPLSAEARRSLVERFQVSSLGAGVEVVTEGARAPGLHVILRGTCGVVKGSPNGDLPVKELKEGDLFGEISLVFDQPAIASVRTLSPSVLLVLPREGFEEVVLPQREVLAAMARLGQERFEQTQLLFSADAQPT